VGKQRYLYVDRSIREPDIIDFACLIGAKRLIAMRFINLRGRPLLRPHADDRCLSRQNNHHHCQQLARSHLSLSSLPPKNGLNVNSKALATIDSPDCARKASFCFI
jgi:hypothetical protein